MIRMIVLDLDGTEMVSGRCNKVLAIEKLLDSQGFGFEDVMAIGDADNDIDVVSRAGLGVAMGNGSASLKSVARHITGSNSENCVAQALRRFIP